MRYEVIDLERIGDEHGALSFMEAGRTIPFEIRRIYYIYDVSVGEVRGHHAHRRLHQAMWCPSGSVEIFLDDGTERSAVMLDTPERIVVLRPGVWRDYVFHRADSTLCVAASDYYDENDYVRDRDEFRALVEGEYWGP